MGTRNTMLERIINLRARADDDASTEAEAMSALNIAAKLMDSYQVDEAELALAEAEGKIVVDVVQKVSDSTVKNKTRKHKVIIAMHGIEKFTNTKIVMWSSGRHSSGKIEITGDRPDAEMANYLIGLIKGSMDRAYNEYRTVNVGVGYGAKAAFQTAMASRINTRLVNMARERDDATNNAVKGKTIKIGDAVVDTSTALVMVNIAKQKADAVYDTFSKAHPRLGTIRMNTYSSNHTAHSAGHSAGNKVNFGKAINRSYAGQIGA